jgi:hypothetical protein
MAADRIALVIQLMTIMAVTMMVLAICVTVVATIAFRKTDKDAASTLSVMIERGGALQLLTVVSIVMSVLVLRILDALGADATVSVLSGVAGYVLGGFATSQGGNRDLISRHNQTETAIIYS